MRRLAPPLLSALASLLLALPAASHDDPRHELAVLDVELRERPADVDRLLRRAELRRRARDLEGSLSDLSRAEQLAPGRRDILFARALTRIEIGDTAGAEGDLSALLEGGPAWAAALEARAKLRAAEGRFAAARDDYTAAIAARPTPELFLARGELDEKRGELARAAAGYAEGVRALGGAVALRLALVRVELSLGRPDRAIAAVDEALRTAPRKAEWLLLRADAHAAAGRTSAAARDRRAALDELERAIAKRPTDLARLARARALVALGRAREALRELDALAAKNSRLDGLEALRAEARRRAGSAEVSP